MKMPYQITIDWNFDYDLRRILERRFHDLLKRARFFKKKGHSIFVDLELLREYKSILKQIKEHEDLNKWNY